MSPADAFDGGCPCREVRYRMTTRPLFVHACHGRWCRRETGSVFALNAMIESDRDVLPAGVPAVPEYDSTAAYWPAAGLQRRDALFAAPGRPRP